MLLSIRIINYCYIKFHNFLFGKCVNILNNNNIRISFKTSIQTVNYKTETIIKAFCQF